MTRAALTLLIGAWWLIPGTVSAAPSEKPLFSRHVVPLFSRLGCNAGVCHGAVKGQNGFRLSLFGVDPGQDHASLLRDSSGRRLTLVDPDSSLLLLKASGRVPHPGGARAFPGSREYQLLRAWIANGAALDKLEDSRVTALRVTPAQHSGKPGVRYPLRVEASFADGSTEDVTDLCTFDALDKDVAAVDFTGQVEARGVGDTALIVRFGAEPVMAHLVVPRPGMEPFPEIKPYNFLDTHVLAKLRRLNVPPSDLCDDATFLRRAALDVTGALPEPEEIHAFLADKDPQKRSKKVDDLLRRPGHAALWATRFCDLLKASGYSGNYALTEAAENRRFYEWLRARLLENTPYDQLAERILTASSREGRPVDEWFEEVMQLAEENARLSPDLQVYSRRRTLDLYWQREAATGVKGTLQVAHAFLGLRMECAQCHRHPHDVWKQDDLLSFANFFLRVKGAGYPDAKTLPAKYADLMKTGPMEAKKLSEEVKKLQDKAKAKDLPAGEADKLKAQAAELQMKANVMTNAPKRFGTEVVHQGDKNNFASVTSPLGTQKSETFRLLGEKQAVAVPREKDPRELVMAWLRQPDNPFFARAIVNRVWAHYLGRGIVDPPDHLSPLNPPSHPELLDELAREFVKHSYDLRWLHTTILTSRTYQQTCRPTETNKADRRNYAFFYLRRLPAEVLVDAVNHATGGTETFPNQLYLPPKAKAVEVAGVTRAGNDTASLAYAFQIFGRPSRNAMVQCDCERDPAPTVVQTLYLANHPRVRDKIASADGRIARILQDIPEDARRIEELFLWAVSRPPSREDAETCLKYLKESPSAQKGLEDLLWSLLNTREFLLNH